MAVFAIVANQAAELLGSAIAQHYARDQWHEQIPGVWFVSDEGTTQDIVIKLGIRNNQLGASAVVLRVSGYAGYTMQSLWEWLAKHPEAVSNG